MKRIGSAGLFACLALTALGSCLQAMAQRGRLRAGAAKVDITPAADELPYRSATERPFVGVHDPLFTRVLVLDDGANEIAIVVIDVTAIPVHQEISLAVAAALGIPQANLLLAASHTHEVPLFSYHGGTPNSQQLREIDRIKESTVTAVREAKARLQPARVAFARGEAWVNVNNGEEEGLNSESDPRGASDKSLDVLQVQAADGKPIAFLVDYADHAEVMFRSVTRDGGYEVSGDLPGVSAKLIEDYSPGAPIVLVASGAGGNQLPIFKSLQPKQYLPAADEGAAGWALLDVQARRLANSILGTIAGMPAGTDEVQLTVSSAMVTCPGKDAAQPAQDPGGTSPKVQIPLGLIRINDIALASVAGDVASEIGDRFKAASPLPNSTMITMTAGSIGYILADSSYLRITHGVNGSPLKAGCAQQAIVQGLVDLIRGPP
jgi:Neutral/alkaline non-lysosomal ceramidase, N-terminal